MKKLFRIAFLFFLMLSLASCSNKDSDDNPINPENYFPLTLANYWNYDITNSNLDLNQTQNTRDSLYVSSANNNAFGLSVNGIATGTMNTILTQLDLTRTATTLQGTGSITFPFEGLDDLQINVTDAILYNSNRTANNELSAVEGTIEQTIEGLPITAEYTLKTVQGESFTSLFLNNINYEHVIASSLILELTITTRVEVIPGSFIDVLILDTQNVLEINNHYVRDIGLVRSEADISYQLEDFSQIGITLPIAGNLNATSVQALNTHDVAEE